jgi:hypothetical protein
VIRLEQVLEILAPHLKANAEQSGTLHTGSPALEPKIESLPWFGTTWYTRG